MMGHTFEPSYVKIDVYFIIQIYSKISLSASSPKVFLIIFSQFRKKKIRFSVNPTLRFVLFSVLTNQELLAERTINCLHICVTSLLVFIYFIYLFFGGRFCLKLSYHKQAQYRQEAHCLLLHNIAIDSLSINALEYLKWRLIIEKCRERYELYNLAIQFLLITNEK